VVFYCVEIEGLRGGGIYNDSTCVQSYAVFASLACVAS